MRPLPPGQGVVVALLLLIAGCGGGGDANPAVVDSNDRLVTAQLADGFSVELTVPRDWAYTDDDGLVAALHGRDLDPDEPSGPRISIGVDLDGMETAFSLLPDGSTTLDAAHNLEVVDDPADIEVAGYAATQLTLRQGTTTRCFTVVFHHGSAHLVVAEAPAASWAEIDSVLETILSTSLNFVSSTAETTSTTSPPPTQPTTKSPTTVGPSTPDAATQPSEAPGFETPQQAIWSELGYDDNEILNCNSGHAGATKPCWDFLGVTDGDETTPPGEVYWFRPHYGEYYWVLVAEPVEGRFEVADVVVVPEDADPFEDPFP